MRSNSETAGLFLAIGNAVYSPDRKTIWTAGRMARLEPRISRLLNVFVERPLETLSRDALLTLVWGDDSSDEALTQAVSRLRRLLGNAATIKTVPRTGYRLAVQPRQLTADEVRKLESTERRDSGARRTTEDATGLTPQRPALVLVLVTVIALLLVVLLADLSVEIERELEVEVRQAE